MLNDNILANKNEVHKDQFENHIIMSLMNLVLQLRFFWYKLY